LTEFDTVAANYQELVSESVRITGESSDYFAAYKAEYVARKFVPRAGSKLLDYGCGVGLLSRKLKDRLGQVRIDGFDVSNDSVARVDQALRAQGTFSTRIDELDRDYDFIVLSNVLHHVKPDERQKLVRGLASLLTAGGSIVVFEHNPINPLTRWAVSQCPFDDGAVLLPARETMSYVRADGFRELCRDYIVFFPRWLAWFRRLEPSLRWCALGAQYVVVAGSPTEYRRRKSRSERSAPRVRGVTKSDG
jgi:2-polyprenyl-3-methyl-5-hydroxy-6-metoxy-1,4-benzoquinol methylase